MTKDNMVYIRLNNEELEKLDMIARKTERNRSQLLRFLLNCTIFKDGRFHLTEAGKEILKEAQDGRLE